MHFRVPAPLPMQVALVIGHGGADFGLPLEKLISSYWPLAVTPLVPKEVTFATFCVSSVVHFAQDTGWLYSVLFHATLLCVAWSNHNGVTLASKLLFRYMCAVHVPCVAAKLLYANKTLQLVTMCASIAVCWVCNDFFTSNTARMYKTAYIEFGRYKQMIVTCHVLANVQLH